MSFSVQTDGNHIEVTTRPKRWNLVLQVLSIVSWSLVALGMSRLLAMHGGLSVLGWLALLASPFLVIIAAAGLMVREVVQVTLEEAWAHVHVFGLRLRQRHSAVGTRRFHVPPKPEFLSARDSAPWVRLADSGFKFGHSDLTRPQANEVAAILNDFLDGAISDALGGEPA